MTDWALMRPGKWPLLSGSEAGRESRVAVDPVPLIAKQATKRPHLIALLLGVAAIVVLGVADAGEPLGPDPEVLIADAFNAWFSGDVESAGMLLSAQSAGVAVPIDEMAYQAAIGAKVTVTDCETFDQSHFDCTLIYSNSLNDAVQAPPGSVPVSVVISDGRVGVVSVYYNRDDYPLNPEIDGSFANYMLVSGLAVEYDGACFADPVRDAACARFQLDHLADWAAWRASQPLRFSG